MSIIGEPWVIIRWRHDTFITIKWNFSRKTPSFSESENPWIFIQQHFTLYISTLTSLEQHIIVVLYPPKHSCIICKNPWFNNVNLSRFSFIELMIGWCLMELTDYSILIERRVVEAEDLCYASQVGMKHHQVPLRIIFQDVQIRHCHLNSPI